MCVGMMLMLPTLSPSLCWIPLPRVATLTHALAHACHAKTQQISASLRPAMAGLVQALVFRRARRACFGYVRGAAMRRLNEAWREKVRW